MLIALGVVKKMNELVHRNISGSVPRSASHERVQRSIIFPNGPEYIGVFLEIDSLTHST
tara:strand:- start:818 stop:994 length:177 start_codon:yes stop_codon:yes gene_type:complete